MNDYHMIRARFFFHIYFSMLLTSAQKSQVIFHTFEQPYDMVGKKANCAEYYYDYYRGFSVFLFLANVIIAFGF